MKIEILPITLDWLDSFWHALDSVAREKKYLAFLEGPPIHETTAFVKHNIDERWPHFVAIYDNNVVGWCDISPLDRPTLSHVGTLGMGVISSFRGQKIGLDLIRNALDAAKKKGLTRVELTVREHNLPAINLYKKIGFKIEGFHQNAICIDGQYENHISMAILF